MLRQSIQTLVALCLASGVAVAAESGNPVRLLFAHSPGCSHCAYQRPIIDEFTQSHPDVKVTRTVYQSLNPDQKSLIEGTRGHPVMVFYRNDCKRQVVGETSLASLEGEYKTFKQQCLQDKVTQRSSQGGSYVVCR